jgi:hypothetical protein
MQGGAVRAERRRGGEAERRRGGEVERWKVEGRRGGGAEGGGYARHGHMSGEPSYLVPRSSTVKQPQSAESSN